MLVSEIQAKIREIMLKWFPCPNCQELLEDYELYWAEKQVSCRKEIINFILSPGVLIQDETKTIARFRRIAEAKRKEIEALSEQLTLVEEQLKEDEALLMK